jgi:hypothetical protein
MTSSTRTVSSVGENKGYRIKKATRRAIVSRKTHVKRGKAARERRRMNAEDCKEGRALDDAAGQLRVLDKRLGKGVGAKKERARLLVLVEKPKTKKAKKVKK